MPHMIFQIRLFSAIIWNEVFSIRQIDAFIDDTMDVTEDDKLITLETGVSGEPDQRYLVQAVLVEGQ